MVFRTSSFRWPTGTGGDGARLSLMFADSYAGTGDVVGCVGMLAQAVLCILLVLSGSFDALTDYTIFAILAFSTLIGGSIFLHRIRRPDAERPYRTLGYPVVPALFLIVTIWLVINTLMTAPGQALAGLGLIALGVPFYWYWSRGTTRT